MTLFWNKISTNRKFNINNFRNTKKHNIFANWSPYKRGLLFHNFLINYFLRKNKTKFINFKKKINNLNIGNPPHIIFNEKYYISYDDCLSFEEISFLKKNFRINRKINVIEIGPGYGRTIETILKNYNINKYYCIDYKNILILTKKYLSKVLKKDEFKKIVFCEFENFNFEKDFFIKMYKLKNFDLFINSDSFHEIEKKIIRNYLNYFSPICEHFFIKNAIAKYKPQDLINHLSKKTVSKYNLKLGLSPEIINIFDEKKIKIQSKKYLKRYNPFKNKQAYIANMLSELYPSCMLSLFKKK